MSQKSPILRRSIVNHTQRIAHVAQQPRSLTKAIVRDAVERYLEALVEEIASGDWVDIPGIGKLQVSREEGKGYITSITPSGQRVRRKVKMRLRTKIRLYEKFKQKCRSIRDYTTQL
jgi:nucleoid DNA-binding protein